MLRLDHIERGPFRIVLLNLMLLLALFLFLSPLVDFLDLNLGELLEKVLLFCAGTLWLAALTTLLSLFDHLFSEVVHGLVEAVRGGANCSGKERRAKRGLCHAMHSNLLVLRSIAEATLTCFFGHKVELRLARYCACTVVDYFLETSGVKHDVVGCFHLIPQSRMFTCEASLEGTELLEESTGMLRLRLDDVELADLVD